MSQRDEEQEREEKKIPTFKSEEEAAAFWDTHSPLDYPEEFQEAQVKFSRPLIKRGLTIKLNDATIKELREIAQEQGIGLSTLIRMWILERLRETKGDRNIA
jgi:hypothetical protein